MLLGPPNAFGRSVTTNSVYLARYLVSRTSFAHSCIVVVAWRSIKQFRRDNSNSRALYEEDTMAEMNANREEGNPNGRGAAQQPGQQPGGFVPNGAAAVVVPAAAHVVVVVANPVIVNLAGALAPPGLLIMHPQFDVETALLGPPATQNNRNFDIQARIQ